MNEERSFFEMRKRVHTRAALSLLLIALTSCTGSRAFREARDEESLEHWDLAVINYSKAVRLDPQDRGYRLSLARAKLKASQFHFEKGKLYRASGRPELAAVLTTMEFQGAFETLMRQENNFYKVIDERTILIATDNAANRKTYEDLVIRTFFLSNADVTEVANSLRSLLQTTRISSTRRKT